MKEFRGQGYFDYQQKKQVAVEEIPVTDPKTNDKDDDRLAGQNLEIYNYLVENPGASNVELMNISKSYSGFTARISNVRIWLRENKGQTIKCRRGTGDDNQYYYWIEKL